MEDQNTTYFLHWLADLDCLEMTSQSFFKNPLSATIVYNKDPYYQPVTLYMMARSLALVLIQLT